MLKSGLFHPSFWTISLSSSVTGVDTICWLSTMPLIADSCWKGVVPGLPSGEAGSCRETDGRLKRVTLEKNQRHSPPLHGPSLEGGLYFGLFSSHIILSIPQSPCFLDKTHQRPYNELHCRPFITQEENDRTSHHPIPWLTIF